MNILLLNAGSSSLKGTLVESNDGRTFATGLADWAGAATRYQYLELDGTPPLPLRVGMTGSKSRGPSGMTFRGQASFSAILDAIPPSAILVRIHTVFGSRSPE
jgi:hypothetical protein